MASKLHALGRARILKDARTGELIIDTDSLQGDILEDDNLGFDDGFAGDVDDPLDDGDLGFDDDPDLSGRRNRKRRRRGRRGGWGMTAVSGAEDYEGPGTATARIRLQHDFKAEDITFAGTLEGSTVTSIFFGDQPVWSTPDGVDVSIFDSNSQLRGLLKGQKIKAGLDITVNGTVPGEGRYAVTITGAKKMR